MPPTPDVRPLTARSTILSVLLGAHPPEATGGELVEWGLRAGINESAVRVALSRMVASGDLERSRSTYRLTQRLLERQAHQDDAMDLSPGPWDGAWLVAAVITVGAEPAVRARLRLAMTTSRFAELREGLWMRPANISWTPLPGAASSLELMTATPERPPVELADSLFDLESWSRTGHQLSEALASGDDLARRLAVAAAIVRHLVTDPLLPEELLPGGWPAPALRSAYQGFRAELIDVRDTFAPRPSSDQSRGRRPR